MATGEALKRFDTDGSAILIGGMKWTSKGEEPKYYQTPYGEVEVLRHVYQTSAGGKSFAYLIVGDGTDRCRLEEKARPLGIHEHVVFAGYIPESEKADHYRLANAYVMPGRGEGFGIVYLEALACGAPVVASKVDGDREAVRGGTLGILIDPNDTDRGSRFMIRRNS